MSEGLHKNGIAINVYHYHKVVIARERTVREFPSLVGRGGVAHIIHMHEHIVNFAASELVGLDLFKGDRFWFGRADIFSCLIKMSLGCLCCFKIVF